MKNGGERGGGGGLSCGGCGGHGPAEEFGGSDWNNIKTTWISRSRCPS